VGLKRSLGPVSGEASSTFLGKSPFNCSMSIKQEQNSNSLKYGHGFETGSQEHRGLASVSLCY
jgi:hypothetical protein